MSLSQSRQRQCHVASFLQENRALPVGALFARATGTTEQEVGILALTDSAVAAIQRVIAEAGDEDIRGIRIAACSSCDGLRYEMGLEATARQDDAVIHIGGLMVFVDADSKPLLDSTEVDFCDTPAATGFIFNGPERCSLCGKRGTCGS